MISKDYAINRLNLTESEYEKLVKWYDKLIKRKKILGHFGAIGGGITFNITPTSIGEVITATCLKQTLVIREL